jgi:preprotein translocase subunit SecY
MLHGLLQAFSIPEVRKRIIFTLGTIIVFRVGAWIPVPGVDRLALADFFDQLQSSVGGLVDFLNMFNGGALEQYSLFALGVIPYINASIIMSLLTSVIPKLKELQREGDEGRRVINRYTRYGTVGLAVVQAFGTAFVAVSQGLVSASVNTVWFFLIAIVCLTAGSMFLMWLGERITENGIGRGISMIIMFGIVASYPSYISQAVANIQANPGVQSIIWIVMLLALFVVSTAGVTLVQLGARRIEIQYAKRVVKGKVYGGQNTFVPLSVNQGGVIPIIFASALLTIPTTLVQSFPNLSFLNPYVGFGTVPYVIVYALLIIFFTYFYAHIVFDPRDLSDNLKRWGGFIPGIRPGQPTTQYIERVLDRLITIGAAFLTIIAVLPHALAWLGSIFGDSTGGLLSFGLFGTSLLIVVGVGIDLIKQIEAHMVERHYESLIQKKGAVLGRRT